MAQAIATILIAGCGNMGGAMLAGWLAAGRDPAGFTVLDPALEAAPDGVALVRTVPDLAPGARFDAILLGVKPQALGAIAEALEPLAGPHCVVLSLLAGIELATLKAQFPRARSHVRVMPNLAAALGQSPLALTADADDATRAAVTALLAPLGTPEWFADDALFDALTALVGSGPAFVYRFIDALGAGGEALGLPRDRAQRLALQMVAGATALAAQADANPAELARRVASPGGTTQAGLDVLDGDAALTRLVTATLAAARDRGTQLARAADRSAD